MKINSKFLSKFKRNIEYKFFNFVNKSPFYLLKNFNFLVALTKNIE